MIFKSDKRLILLTFILLFSALFFAFSHIYLGGSKAKLIVLAVLLVFIIFNLVSLIMRQVVIDDDKIVVRTVLGRKSIKLNEIIDAVFLYLKGRTILILSDNNQFVFISSVLDDFDRIVKEIDERVNESIKEKLRIYDRKRNKKSKLLLYTFIIASILFLVIFGAYNLISL